MVIGFAVCRVSPIKPPKIDFASLFNRLTSFSIGPSFQSVKVNSLNSLICPKRRLGQFFRIPEKNALDVGQGHIFSSFCRLVPFIGKASA
jgi:hypothetical protein